MKPDLIYFLTDGDQTNNKAVLEDVRKLNADKKVRVNTVAFVSDAAALADEGSDFPEFLRALARENGGEFRIVEARKLGYGVEY